jgi:Kef-type K+ transport system membrane component KefB/Trk K+ transport system NAD-binding subunit
METITSSGLYELALIILMATILGILARILRQPIILSYIVTGLLFGLFGYFHLINKEVFQVFSNLGIMFLLFLVGLEINYTSLRLVGKISVILGLTQIIFTASIGFFIALYFNFTYLQSAYIAIALTFSSTIIIVKLLSEKKDLNSLYGKISIGFLLVQDLVAVLILILLSGIANNGNLVISNIILALIKGFFLFTIMIVLGRKFLPKIFDKIAHSQELLFITSLAWVLSIASIISSRWIGFSIEIGGFLAGLALANSSQTFEIAAKIKYLRDFFILIFFVILGSSFANYEFLQLTWPVIVLSLFVLIGNPLIILIIMYLFGYRRRTSFLCALTVAQISEFSLILVHLGQKLGHLTQDIVSLVTVVGIITIAISSYMIIYNEELFRFLSPFLKIFERRKKYQEEPEISNTAKPIILIGAHRLGQNIITDLPKENLLIIDFDPEIINKLKKLNYTTLLGDISDLEIREKANIQKAQLVISTSPDFEDNLRLLKELISLRQRPKIIVRGNDEIDALLFYKNGADYVILPYFTAGQYLGRSIAIDPQFAILDQLRDQDLALLKTLEKEKKEFLKHSLI